MGALIHLPNGESRLHPEDKSRVLALVDDYLSDRVASYELEHRLRHKDGTYRWIHTVAVLQRDRKASLADDRIACRYYQAQTGEQTLSQSESTLRGSSRVTC